MSSGYKVIFEIPVYYRTEEEFPSYYEKRKEKFIASLGKSNKEAEKWYENQYFLCWNHNDIIGWIDIYIEDMVLRADFLKIKATRVTTLTKKREYKFEAYYDICLIENQSNRELSNKIKEFLSNLNLRHYLPKYFIDTECVFNIIDFIDFRKNAESIRRDRHKTESNNMNAEEKKLLEEMHYYDDLYFSDLKFEKAEIVNKLGKIQFQVNGSCEPYEDFPYDVLLLKEIDDWQIKSVDKIDEDGSTGLCDSENKVIKIKRRMKKQEVKLALLHELIHFYEAFFDQYKLKAFEQWLCLYLYEKLKKKLGKSRIDALINTEVNFFVYADSSYQSYHSLLFLLKSLELDQRLEQSPGTIYSYRREKLFGKTVKKS